MRDSDFESHNHATVVSQARLSRLLQCTASGFWEWQIGSRDEHYWSPYCYELLGYQNAEFTPNSKRFEELLHSADRQPIKAYLEDIAVADVPIEAEFRMRMKSGKYRWIRSSGRSFAEGNQNIVVCVITGCDRTDESEAPSRETAELYCSIFHHSLFGKVVLNLNGEFTHVNDAACNLLGFERNELLSKCYTDITVSPNRSTSHCQFQELLDGTSEAQTREQQFRRKDGTILSETVTISKLSDSHGKPQHILVCFHSRAVQEQAEHRLCASEEKFRSIYEQSPIAIQEYDLDGNLVSVNSETLKLFGLDDLAEIQHFNLWNDPNLTPEKAKILKSGQPIHISTSVFLSKETFPFPENRFGQIDLDMYVTPLRVATTITGYLVQIVDTTEQVEATKNLRRSERMFRLFFEQHFLFMAILSPEGRVIEVNDYMLEICGFQKHDYVNEHFWNIPAFKQLPETQTLIRERIELIEKQGGHIEVEDDYQTADGAIRTVSAVYTSVKNDESDLHYIVMQAHDITERKRTEESLRDAKQRLQEIAENVHDLFCIISPDWQTILYASPAYERIWGRSLQSLYDSPDSWQDAILAEDLPSVHEAIEQLMQSGRDGLAFPNYRIRRPDGEIRWVEASAYLVLDPGGNIIRIVGNARDVTEQKAAERELRAREATLAHINRVNTLGEMAGILAHELSQPLSAIANYTGTVQYYLEQMATTADVDLLIDSMSRSLTEVKRARAIVTHLRDLVRGREPKQIEVDINKLLDRAIELMMPVARDKSVRFMNNLNWDLPTVYADPVQVEQVVINLVANGFDALSELDAERRTISIATQLSDDDFVEVIIQDSGLGVEMSLRESLFKPFVTTKEGGLGVGLSICRSIINSLGGRIWVDHGEQVGARFHFTLPTYESMAEDGIL